MNAIARQGKPERRFASLLTQLAFVAILVFSALPASADPLTLLLLKMLRDQVISRSLEAAWEARNASATNRLPPAPVAPPAVEDLDDRQIRKLIDESFINLSAAQRDEVYGGLQKILQDPENAAARKEILGELVQKAFAIRQVNEQLKQLSYADKQRLATQARAEYARLSDEDRRQVVQVLKQGVAPIPRDLSEMMLAEFGRDASSR